MRWRQLSLKQFAQLLLQRNHINHNKAVHRPTVLHKTPPIKIGRRRLPRETCCWDWLRTPQIPALLISRSSNWDKKNWEIINKLKHHHSLYIHIKNSRWTHLEISYNDFESCKVVLNSDLITLATCVHNMKKTKTGLKQSKLATKITTYMLEHYRLRKHELNADGTYVESIVTQISSTQSTHKSLCSTGTTP